jgi:uncharacterized cupredoxin-like copper-binding protein
MGRVGAAPQIRGTPNLFCEPKSRETSVNASRRTTLVLALATIVVFAAVVALLGLGVIFGNTNSGAGGTTSGTVLPAGCVKPANGFLIIASKDGYNDSILQGAGLSKPWPVMSANLGQVVNITVCNVDVEAHGFQVAKYFDSSIHVVEPGQVLNVSFVASQEGSFLIYCAIPCSIHFFMQFGQVRVSA